MARSMTGTYTLPPGINPVIAGTVITDGWANNTLSDVATAVTQSLDRLGRGGMQAPMKAVDGTMVTPGLTFNNESGTGFYRAAAGNLRLSILGADRMIARAAGVEFLDIPTAPTAAPADSTTKLATTEYVTLAGGVISAVVATVEEAAAVANALKANIDSPALTGTPTAPTAAPLTDTLQLANTAFVREALNTLPAGTLPSIVGKALQGLRVNAAETGVEFANIAPLGPRNWFVEQFTASTTFVVPAGVRVIRPYAFGAGAAGTTSASGGGGGCAYGDIAVTPAQAITLTISGGVATVTVAGVAMLTANPASGITGGTASRNGAVTNAGNFSGGAGFSNVSRGGASSGSPLGVGVTAANVTGGSGWGGAGAGGGGGGVGGAATASPALSGPGLSFPSLDPLLDGLLGPSVPFISAIGLPGILGSGGNGNGAFGTPCGAGSFGAGGGGSAGASINGGAGGFGGGGGGGGSGASSTGGAGGFGGGGGSAAAAGGAGGAAVIRIYY